MGSKVQIYRFKVQRLNVLGCLFLQSGVYLNVLRKLAGGEFRIDLFPVNEHLKAAVVIWCERELANPLFVLSE